jgi:hypothetical protein
MNKIGKWVEKEVFENRDFPIYEWQSARCSICGKYHTTPYGYYFDIFNYCPNCGRALNKTAIEIETNKILNIRLETLLKLTDLINDEKTLLLINDIALKIKNSKSISE